MFRLLRLAAAWAGAAAVATSAGACQAQLPPKVAAVIDRTKTTRASYAVYVWYRITRTGQPPVQEWSAEFNSGRLHRVETPHDRVIADCDAMTGSRLMLVTGKVTTGPEIAATACGIDSNYPVDSAEWLGASDSGLGPADVIRITGGPYIRTYTVNSDGVIVRSSFQSNTPEHPYVLQTVSTELSPTLPDADMFTGDSLSRSFVPDRYKTGPSGQRW